MVQKESTKCGAFQFLLEAPFFKPRTWNFPNLFSNLSIELYTDEKDPELEDQVEAVLNDHEFFWNKSEVWIETEKLYEVLYQMTV